jgi:uracil-DNA glycosylase family 4
MGHVCGREALLELEEAYGECTRCPLLVKSRKQVVFGGGSSRASILVVGEVPGEEEDAEGVTHVGDSGKLLMDVFARAWPVQDDPDFSEAVSIGEDAVYFEKLRNYLDEHVFWTNAVLCRTEDKRTPSAFEVKNCSDRLRRTIYAVDPALIIATGKTPASILVGKSVAISDKHGVIFDISIPSPVTGNPVRYPMLAIMCPSQLLREGDQKLVKKKQGKTYETIEDLRYALRLLNRLFNDYYQHSFLEP